MSRSIFSVESIEYAARAALAAGAAAWAFALTPVAQAGQEAAGEEEEPKWTVAEPLIEGAFATARIETDEGTWMSLDVSPDGRTIAFDMLGDIYTMPITGGRATNIASGLAWDMQPRFSPDGAKIAFTSDRSGGDNIWVMNADGSDPQQITKEDFRLLNNPAWTPDGEYIAARKHFTTARSLGTGEIWLYSLKGGSGVALVERPSPQHQKEIGEPVFSPDGRYLYYSQDTTPGATFQYAQDSNGQIFEIRRYDMETGEITDAVSGPGGAVRAQPSPNGEMLAFVRRVRDKSVLFVKDLASGAERAVYDGLDKDMQEVWAVHGAYPNMDWLDDSRHIVLWAGGKIRRVDVETGADEIIPFEVADERRIIPARGIEVEAAPESFETKMARFAAHSPDGRRAVFESLGKLYVKDLPDGAPRRLTRDGGDHFELHPAFSRDGRNIVFVSWDDSDLGAVRVVSAGGGRSRVVTRAPGHYTNPAFSPDGDWIVYRKGGGGFLTSPLWSDAPGIYRVSARGGEAVKLTDGGSNPHFGARGDRVFYNGGGGFGGGAELRSVNIDGHDGRTHASGDLVTGYSVSPDGRYVAFTENYQVFIAPMPPGAAKLSLDKGARSVKVVKASGDGGFWPHWTEEGLGWALGPTLFHARIGDLFSAPEGDEEGGGYEPPETGADLARRIAAEAPQSRVAFLNARIITMADETGGVIERGVVLVEGARIAAVGPMETTAIPDGYARVDLEGGTIIPGLIDMHAHGGYGGGDIIPQQNWRAMATLAFGVTTVHDPSNQSSTIFAASEMQRAGMILAPRTFSTGRIVYGARAPGAYAEVNSIDDALEHVRRLKAQGAISVKNYNQPRRDQRQQVAEAARREGLLVVPEGGALYHMDMSLIADGNNTIEHNIPQNVLYKDVIDFWRQTDVGYTPTLVVTYSGIGGENYWYEVDDVWKHPLLTRHVPKHILNPRSVRRQKAPNEDYADQYSAREARKLMQAGVSVHIGAHGQREGLGSHWEMWSFARGGMTPLEALKTATVNPARQLGMDADIGSIAPGKLADMVILRANPLENIRNSDEIDRVMLNGRLYDAATLNETVTGDRRRAPYYWE